jgi:hypothetical protein
MSPSLKLIFITLGLLLTSCVGHTSCPKTEVRRVLSPDRKHVIIIYDINCRDNHSLYAVLEDQRDWFFWRRRPVFCSLETPNGNVRQLDARWLDNKHIEVTSPDEVENGGQPAPTFGTCNDITVAYKFKVKPPPKQEAPDEQTVAAIHEAINQTEGCIRQGGPNYADYLRNLVDRSEHRQALELLCTILIKGKCPISKETYALLEPACIKMGVASIYLNDLKALVR